MSLKLIPLIEIRYDNPSIDSPKVYDYWAYPGVWAAYREQCLLTAGFSKNLQPYRKGYPFYLISELPEEDLIKLVLDYTQDVELPCPFSGGFVLREDTEDLFFPQCCGALNDIYYWERLALGKKSYCEGHPVPAVSFEGNEVLLDFSIRDVDESFMPPPAKNSLRLSRLALEQTVAEAKQVLFDFQKRLENINETRGLGIANIGRMLIWEEGNVVEMNTQEVPFLHPQRALTPEAYRRPNPSKT